MARIRTLKPEVLEDERTASLSDAAFRLFVSMIVLADDHGNVRADDRWLKGQVWWACGDSPRVSAILGELAQAGLILAYRVREQMYVHLRGWEKHQRIDNRGKPRVPGPKDKDAQDVTIEDSNSRGGIPRIAANCGDLPLDHDHDHDPDHDHDLSGKPDDAVLVFAERATSEINRIAGTSYRANSKAVLKDCRVLVKAKHTPDVAVAVIQSKRRWATDAVMSEHFKPSALLRPNNFERYVDDLEGKRKQPKISAPPGEDPPPDLTYSILNAKEPDA